MVPSLRWLFFFFFLPFCLKNSTCPTYSQYLSHYLLNNFYSIYIILKCHFHRWIYLSRRELHCPPAQTPNYPLTTVMSVLGTDIPQLQWGSWWPQIQQNNFSTLARVNGSGKVSNPDLSYSVQDNLLATTLQLRVKCLEGEGKKRFLFCSGRYGIHIRSLELLQPFGCK